LPFHHRGRSAARVVARRNKLVAERGERITRRGDLVTQRDERITERGDIVTERGDIVALGRETNATRRRPARRAVLSDGGAGASGAAVLPGVGRRPSNGRMGEAENAGRRGARASPFPFVASCLRRSVAPAQPFRIFR
jgi:hypothetical protein